MAQALDTGATAWVLASSALVLLMTPGLAFFYGGMVRVKSVLNMLMMNFICIAVVSVLWVAYGWSLAFSPDVKNGMIGGLHQVLLHGFGRDTSLFGTTSVPVYAVVCFQLMFAIITPALISGAIADRAKFAGWAVYVAAWVSVVYFPVAHWVFAPDGWLLAKVHVLDFAGGTAVHINAGAAGLACALVIGKRLGWRKDQMRPHNVPFVMLGAGLLWFGWFGFNAGSALNASGQASMVFINTQVATAAALLGWLAVERIRDGHFTSLGAASGAVAGLVAITPACAAVSPGGAILLGFVAGAVCALAISLKFRFGFDDSLDVVGVHLVGGIVGSMLIGLLATKQVVKDAGANAGLFYGGGFTQLGRQAVGVLVVGFYSFLMSLLIAWIVNKTVGFRVSPEEELAGVDELTHAETAYDFGGVRASLARSSTSSAAVDGSPSQEKVQA